MALRPRLVFAVLVVSLLAGCAGGIARPAGSLPIGHGDAHRPGTMLPFGLRVPVGATMIGPVLPGAWLDQSELQFDSSQTAFLAIDGTPGPVVSNVIEQAEKRGFVGGVGCSPLAGTGHVVTCAGSLDDPGTLTSTPPPASARCIAITVDYGTGEVPFATIGLIFGSARSYWCGSQPSLSDGVDFGGASKPHFTTPVRVGDPMLTGYFAGVHVEPGSHVVADVLMNIVLLRIDADPDRVIDSYLDAARNFDHPFFKLTGPRRSTRDGWRIRSWESRDQEGDAFQLDVLQEKGRTYVMVHQVLDY